MQSRVLRESHLVSEDADELFFDVCVFHRLDVSGDSIVITPNRFLFTGIGYAVVGFVRRVTCYLERPR